ncbi:hypothetical protein AGMMS50267_07220 [Spirochaetia bacterium]|nr:hypothetical protein AGMMS50267_07220 [Spirochaetia bacterium]
MDDNAALFWEHIKKEVRAQNTTQEWVAKKAGISFNTFEGWKSKGIFPRVNDAVRIAAALNTSVEYLVTGVVRDHASAVEVISRAMPQIHKHLEAITKAMREL